jgi:FkbM family methyltransferase
MPNAPAQISRVFRTAVRRAQHPDFFFVNIGANDGVSNDPIYPFLCEYGWRGIAVEPLEPVFAELERNYQRFPGVILERAAVAPEPRPFYFIPATTRYERTWTKQVGTLDPGFLRRAIDLMRTYEFEGPVPPGLEQSITPVEVPCLTFAALMEKHRVERVDFVNIDAEGVDYEIVRTIDLARWRPQILCLETADMSEAQRDDLGRRFAAHGYVFLEPFDMSSSVYVRRAIAPGVAARGLRRVRAGMRAALGR